MHSVLTAVYRAIPGETEAYSTMERLDLDDKGRRNNYPNISTSLTCSDLLLYNRTNISRFNQDNRGQIDFLPDNTTANVVSTFNQFVGEKGNLNTSTRLTGFIAKTLKSIGINDSIIKKITNWHKGREGIWRYEIEDKSSFVTSSNQGKDFIDATIDGNSFEVFTLGNIYNNKELYSIYPELADIYVAIDHTETPGIAYYDPSDNHITFGPSLEGIPYDRETIIKGLVHEVQHTIQFIEGFPQGTNPNSKEVFNEVLKYIVKSKTLPINTKINIKGILYDLLPTGEPKYDKEAKETLNRLREAVYKAVPGEVEARDSETRLNLTTKERKNLLPEIIDAETSNSLFIYDKNNISRAVISSFNQDNRGQIDFLSDNTTRIIFSDKADASTAIHEFEHLSI